MDPISTAIITAITTGVIKTAERGIGAAYHKLKDAIKEKFGADSVLVEAIEMLEERPESAGWKEDVEKQVQATQADQDPDLKAAAEALLEELKAQPGGEQRIQQIVKDSIGVAQATGGGTATVTIGKVPEKKDKK